MTEDTLITMVGPLVRLNPNELHFNDPQFYEQVYAGNMTKTNKDPWATGLTGLQTAVAVTLDHDHHRRRRGYYANFFSKKSTLGREGFIKEKVDKLMQRMQEAHHRRETITGITAFGALTTDVISHYAYGECFDALDVPGMPSPLTRDIKCMLQTGHFRRFLPYVTNLMEKLPDRWLKWLSPAMGTFLDLNTRMEALGIAALEKSYSKTSTTAQQTIFDALMDPQIPAEEKTLLRLKDESTLILGAGLDTTSRFLTCAVCYMCSFPHVLAKLRAELKIFGNMQPTLTQLEALPYLVRVVQHTLPLMVF
jgi:cytochrome P450